MICTRYMNIESKIFYLKMYLCDHHIYSYILRELVRQWRHGNIYIKNISVIQANRPRTLTKDSWEDNASNSSRVSAGEGRQVTLGSVNSLA